LNNLKKFFGVIFFVALSLGLFAQESAMNTYDFLKLSNSARVASLGGDLISVKDNDLNLTFHNPSLLNSSMDNNIVLNYITYFSDINFGYISYSKSFEKKGNFAVGLHYINYGEFIEANEFGDITGNKFYASEYALNLLWSKSLDSLFSIGINMKPVYSKLETYESYGIAGDIGITYNNEKKLFAAALVVKNIGSQIKTYHDENFEPLPFDVQLGISVKAKHAPFRLSFLGHNLHKFDLTYEDPQNPSETIDPISGEVQSESKINRFSNKLFRHLIVGVEFIPSKNFFVNLGYNHQRREELKLSTRTYIAGFSWGFGLKLSKFKLSYGSATYHLAGSSNHFSLSMNLNEFYSKKS
jgi:hypothetical protein